MKIAELYILALKIPALNVHATVLEPYLDGCLVTKSWAQPENTSMLAIEYGDKMVVTKGDSNYWFGYTVDKPDRQGYFPVANVKELGENTKRLDLLKKFNL